jgi:hypothetical protein
MLAMKGERLATLTLNSHHAGLCVILFVNVNMRGARATAEVCIDFRGQSLGKI